MSSPPIEGPQPFPPPLGDGRVGGLRVHRLYGRMGPFQSPVSEISPVAATQPRLGIDPLRRPPRTVHGSVTTV
jgi:hypothetical protein